MHATNKPFNIEKRLVYEAYKAVKSNQALVKKVVFGRVAFHFKKSNVWG